MNNLQTYKDLANIGLNLAMNNLGYADMDATQETSIRAVANGTTTQAAKAKVILFDAFGEVFDIDKPTISTGGSSKRQNALMNVSFPSMVGFSPNPANQHFQIHWSHSISEANLHIYNAVGKKIEQYKVQNGENIAIIHLSSGLYICTLEIAETIQLHQKLVVNH